MVGILSRPTWYKYPSMKHALVTGGAGFIGSHLVDSLLADGWRVTVFDNFDPFYDAAIKERNVGAHLRHPAFTPVRGDLRDRQSVTRLSSASYDVIVHLAARAGVRPSIEDPSATRTSTSAARSCCSSLPGRWTSGSSCSPRRAASTG